MKLELENIKQFGIQFIWRNSTNVRYLRVRFCFWTYKFEIDLFRKEKLLDKLRKWY